MLADCTANAAELAHLQRIALACPPRRRFCVVAVEVRELTCDNANSLLPLRYTESSGKKEFSAQYFRSSLTKRHIQYKGLLRGMGYQNVTFPGRVY